jgi:tryptophanyl-tRNA synthetase
MLSPIQEKYKEIIKSQELQDILNQGRETASTYAYRKMLKCKRKIGLGRK